MSCVISHREMQEVEDVWVPEEGEDGDYIHFGTKLLFTCEELPRT